MSDTMHNENWLNSITENTAYFGLLSEHLWPCPYQYIFCNFIQNTTHITYDTWKRGVREKELETRIGLPDLHTYNSPSDLPFPFSLIIHMWDAFNIIHNSIFSIILNIKTEICSHLGRERHFFLIFFLYVYTMELPVNIVWCPGGQLLGFKYEYIISEVSSPS